jgi:hypothetical protein
MQEAVQAYREENKDMLRLASLYKSSESQLRRLYRDRKKVIESRLPEEEIERRKEIIEERIDQIRIRFNREYNSTFKFTGLG